MAGIVEMILDGKYTDLKENIEQRIAEKMVARIRTEKENIITKINEGK